MLVLGLDTSTSACSAAVWRDGAVVARRLRAMARGQSEALVPMIAEVLAEAGVAAAQIDLVAVTVGPGAFTGLRIGLAAARGLALAAGVPVAGVSTPVAVAAAVPEVERAGRALLVAVESKRDEIWVQGFDAQLTPLGPVAALKPEAAAALIEGPLVVAGDAAALVLAHRADALAASSPGWPDAGVVAALAAAGSRLAPEPLYLRPADVTVCPSS
jgi:tRNA threonylcarbamoyladenosine biosynthesis protein TsaB